jgi:hypothetical protein
LKRRFDIVRAFLSEAIALNKLKRGSLLLDVLESGHSAG